MALVDELFNALELRNPDHLALKQYRIFKMAAGKTAKSILISLGVRLEKFNLPQIASVVSHDELNLPSELLACIIFSLFSAADPVVTEGASAVATVWAYMGELIFNLLVLTGAVKMSERVVREVFGL